MSACSRTDRKSTRLNSRHVAISYAVFCLKKKKRYMSCRHRIGSNGGSNPPERGLGPWGGFAEYIHLHPNAILHKVRGDISFFFNDTATTEIYTLSLHDALPI